MKHPRREQIGHPRPISNKDKLSYSCSIGSDKIQVSITDCNRLIGANIQPLQSGEKGLGIWFQRAIIAAQYNVEGERIALKDMLNA